MSLIFTAQIQAAGDLERHVPNFELTPFVIQLLLIVFWRSLIRAGDFFVLEVTNQICRNPKCFLGFHHENIEVWR